MTRAKQHPKAVVCLVMLAIAAVGALIIRDVLGASDGGTVIQDEYSAAWEISAYNLSYNSSTQRTRSTHRYLFENSGDSEEGGVIKRKYTFAHRIVTDQGNLTYNANGNPKVERIESTIGAPLSPGAYQEHSDTIGVSVADLEGGRNYKIQAYTRLTLYKVTLGTPLAQPDGP